MDVSPLPPIDRGSPTTCRVSRAMGSRSAGVIPTSSVVMYRPPRVVDEPPEGPEQRLRLVGARVGPDERLAAPQGQPGHGGLVGHRPGEPQHVRDGGLLRRVRPYPHAAARRPQRSVVHGDECLQPGRRVAARDEQLVSVFSHVGQCVQSGPPRADEYMSIIANLRNSSPARLGSHPPSYRRKPVSSPRRPRQASPVGATRRVALLSP